VANGPQWIAQLVRQPRGQLSERGQPVRPPHRLLRFERDDGTVYRMAKCERIPYWSMHDPGGEAWWPEGLRPAP